MLKSTLSQCLVAAAVLAGSMAYATAPSNWSGTPLVAGDLNEVTQINSEKIKFQTKGPTDTAVQRLEWQAGGNSGWHHHPGMVIVQVASGVVTVHRYVNGACTTKDYGPTTGNGSTFTEGDTPHMGYSAGGAVAYATAIVENHTPKVFRLDDPAPDCVTANHVRSPG